MENDKKTLFLVDDDLTNLTVGKKVLSGTYTVVTLNSGARLFAMLEKIRPALILLDVNMPEQDGYDVIRELKKDGSLYAEIPVIFLTALQDEEKELMGLSLGAIDYITKPFSPCLLLKRLEVHLLVESQKRQLMDFNENLTLMVEDRTRSIVELKNALLTTIAELVESRDDITGGHIERTKTYIKLFLGGMKERELYKEELEKINEESFLLSSMLHDVGKISVRDSILSKPDKLTAEEFDKMKVHTVFGDEIMQSIKKKTRDSEFVENARIFALTHHEKWDGSGYPGGLRDYEIPIQGRIMAIVDVYDALVEARPYKKAFTHEKAVQIIKEGRGTHFDPLLVDLFSEMNETFDMQRRDFKNA